MLRIFFRLIFLVTVFTAMLLTLVIVELFGVFWAFGFTKPLLNFTTEADRIGNRLTDLFEPIIGPL